MYGKIKNEIPRENRRFSGTQSSEFLRNSRGRDTKYDIRKKSLLKATAIVTIAVFLFNTVFIDLVWALPKATANSFLRAIPAEESWVAKAIGEKLGKEPDKRNIASGNWTEEYHDELNAQIRKLIGKKRTDVTGQYPVEKQKRELNALLKDFFTALSKEEKAKWNGIISDANLAVNDTEELFKKLAGLLNSKKTGFFYLKPPKGVFYLKRQGLPPLIAEEHFGHNRKSKTDKKEINNLYIAEPSVKLKTNEEQQGIILHGLVHLLIGAGEAKHNFALKVQMRFERYLLEKEIPADFLKKYSRYYELKSEILEAEKANDNRLYQKKRAELIKTVDYLRELAETIPDEQFKRAFELLKLNQIENQEDVNLMLGSFDEFYHLSTPEYNTQEKAVLEEIAREMAQGLKKWHNPDEVYQEAMSGMKTFHIKNFLPESIDEKNELKRRFLSGQIRSGIQKFNRANHIGACFARELDAVSVLTKGLGNRDSSVSFLKAAVKHELIHYFSFQGIIPIRYEREDISTAITVIEFLEQEGMEIFNKYQNAFTPAGSELYRAGAKLQKEGKVFLDEEYLLKRAFEIFEADERLADNAIMLVRDPIGRNAEETAALSAQVNDMRQRVIGVIIAGALIQHSKESGEPLLETLIEFFKVLAEKAPLPRVAEIEEAIKQAKEMGVPEKDMQELNQLLRKAQKRKDEVEKIKGYILTWARSKTAIPELVYVEAGEKIPQWAFLPAHKKIVGVEEDLYRFSSRAAYGLVVPPVFEAKYGADVREKLIEDEFKDEPYFDLLWRIMDTPRIMAFGWHSYPGTIDWVKAVYEERFKEDNLLIAQTLLSAWARPLQYLDSFIYRWFKGIDEDRRLKNKDVRQAIENTKDAYRRVMETITPEELYHLVKDEIWPEFKKLIESEIAEQKDMELFKQEHQGVSPNQIQQMWDGMSDVERQAVQREMEKQWQSMSDEERQKIIEEVERQIQEAIEEYLAQSSRAQAGGERSSQSPAMPGQTGALKTSGFSRKPAEGKSEDMNRLAGQLQRMAERLKEKAENLSRQSNQTGGGAKGLSKEAEDVEGNAGAADLSKDVEELAKTAQETAEGFSSLKKQTEQFKNRANALNEAASRSSDLDSADKMKQSSEKLNRTAEDMDRTAGKGKGISQEAVEDAKQIKDIISKSGRREVNAIRQKAEALSKKADELAKYARDLAGQAGEAESQAGEAGQSASEMGMETAQRAKDGEREKGEGRREKGEGKQKAEAGESSWDMKNQKTEDPEGQAYGAGREPEALRGIDSLARETRNRDKIDDKEFDLSKYLEEEPSIPAPKEEISKRTKEQIREHERQMKKMREENFLKKEGITVGQHQIYQRAKADVQAQIVNIERELKSILGPGGGSEFLRERSYGEIDDDSLAEIPAGKTKIFKQQQKPQKKKAVISLLVDISGSMKPENDQKFEDSKLAHARSTALAFQEALKKFEFSSNVDLQFEVAGYNEYAYIELKDYKDKLTLEKAFKVIYDLETIEEGSGGTSDYQALSLAIQRMRQTKLGNDSEAKKIILNITDGNAGRNAGSIQKLYARNPDIRIISFGIDENEETARAIALSYGKRYGVAVSNVSTVPKVVMRRLKLELKRPVPSDVARTIINNALIFGFSSLSGAILMGTNGLIQFMKDIDFNELPKEEPVYEGSKFLIVRENRKEFLVYRDPETEEEKIRIERGPRRNKRVPKIEWNPAFETEQNIEFLIKMFQRLEPREEDNLMRNLLLSGEAGTGKNVLIEYAAKLANQNLRLMSIHKRTDKNQLIKRRTFGEEKSPDGKYLRKTGWANSELVEAAINGDWIILDEINKAEADNLGVLNDMLAMGRFIDKNGKTRKVDKDFRIIAAANPPDGIYAVNALSGEFIDRMSRLELDYQREEDEIKLLQSWAPNVPKERIELLVQAAWNLRARYFGWTSRANMLAEDEVPAEKGTYIKRPISTAELRKIVEHFDKYPYNLKNRPWSVINRHFSLANEDPLEVEIMKEEIRSEFEGLGFQDKISIEDIVIQPENNQIEIKEDKATGVKTRFWKIKPDKGGDELNLKLIDEGPADKNEEPEKLIDEVPRNLVHFYDIAQDISLGNPLLFTGHAGTGKNVIADFVSYMLAGGAYLISINRLIEPGDLTAWRGFAELSEEEKTEWIESFIVKAMREGKPVIIDEVNKADPGVVAILNNLLQTNTLTLPSGEVVEAKPGFCLIATMNPPISGLYEGVEPLSGEFIRRFSIHEFDYLPFEQELEILKKTGKYKVNEKYIERLLKAAEKLREKYIQEGAIARPPSMRPLKRTIARIRDYGDRLPGGKKKRKDEQIFEIFEEDFPLDDRTQKEAVKNVFKESDIALLPAGRVDEKTPDAIDELLDGQPLVLRGEIKIEPDTGDKTTDDILKVLQLNYDAVGAGKKIEALAKLIEEKISEWSETDFKRHIESALYFREIMKVTLIVRGMAHSKDNLRSVEKLEQRIEKHLLAYHWPATFFIEAPEIDVALLKIVPGTQDTKINEILGLLQIFGADENYRKDLLKVLRNEYIEGKLKDINEGQLDGSIDEANLLSRMKKTLDKIAKDIKTQDARALKELSKFIAEELRKSGWPVSNRKFEDENILWQRYLGVLQQSAGLKNKEEIEAAQKKAEEIFEKAKDLEEARINSLYSFDIFRGRIFELLWGVQTARAPNSIKRRLEQLDKEFLNDFMDDIVWENRVYDNEIILKFLWIKDYLSEILTSLNKDNACRSKECANIIKDYINKIDEQFKTYHWPAYQKLKPFMQEFPRIGGPVTIGLTQEPIVLQPAVSAEQIEQWKVELVELKRDSDVEGEVVQMQSVITEFWEQEEKIKKAAVELKQPLLEKRGEIMHKVYTTVKDLKSQGICIEDPSKLVRGDIIYFSKNGRDRIGMVASNPYFRAPDFAESILYFNVHGNFSKDYSILLENAVVYKYAQSDFKFLPIFSQPRFPLKNEINEQIKELEEKIREAEKQSALAAAGEVSGREEMLRVMGEMEKKQKTEDREQKADLGEKELQETIEFIHGYISSLFGRRVGGDASYAEYHWLKSFKTEFVPQEHELLQGKGVNIEIEVEQKSEESDGYAVINDNFTVTLYIAENTEDSVELLKGFLEVAKEKSRFASKIELIEKKIEELQKKKDEKESEPKEIIVNLMEEWGLWGLGDVSDDMRREIVRLGVEYLIISEDRKEKSEKILEEIKGYFEYVDASGEMTAKEMWDVSALAMRVYRLVGGKLEKKEVSKLVGELDNTIIGDGIKDIQNFIQALADLFTDNMENNNLDGTEIESRMIVNAVKAALKISEADVYISKQLIHALKEMFDVWENEEVRKRIVNILTNTIKPENDKGLNMEILETLGKILEDAAVISKLVIREKFKEVVHDQKYSQQLKVKAKKGELKESLNILGDSQLNQKSFFSEISSGIKSLSNSVDKLASLELIIENIDLVKKDDKVEKAILELLDDNNLEVRLAAVEALVKMVGDDEFKKEEFRKKIWGMWDKKKPNNQVADFVSVYAWALWELGWDRNEIAKQIYDMFGKIARHSDTGDILGIVVALCEIDVYTKEDKQKRIYQLIKSERIDNEIINSIRPQILDYLAKQIDESFKEKFESIIDGIIEQLQKENISSNLKADFTEFLKKIYKKVGDKGKEIIKDRIFPLSPEMQLAVLPDEALLPVYPDNAGLLENEKTGAEYVERVFKILPEKIKAAGYKPQATGYEKDWEKLKKLTADSSEEAVNFAGDMIKKWRDELSNEEVALLEKLIGLIREETKVEIEISSVNYGKSCQAYFEALKKGDEAEISQTYQRLMAEIKVADSLEMVESLQRMYLYLMQQLSVTPIPFALLRYGADGRPRTIRSPKDEPTLPTGRQAGQVAQVRGKRKTEVSEEEILGMLEEWGFEADIGDVRKLILRFAGEYLMKSTVDSPQSIENKEELEKILEEIRGYFKYKMPNLGLPGDPELLLKYEWDVRALALRVYRLVGGVLTNGEITDLHQDPEVITDDSKDYSLAFIEVFAAQLDRVVLSTSQQEFFIKMAEKLLSLSEGNIFVSKRVVQVFKQMFMNWKDEKVRGIIVNILTNAIKPDNDDALNMEILEALDEIRPEISVGAQNRIIATSGYSQQLKIKAQKAYFQRLLFGSRPSPSPAMWSAPGKASFIDYVSRWQSDTLLNKLALIELVVENIDVIRNEGVYDDVEKAILELLDDDYLEVRLAAAEALVKLAGDDEVKKAEFREKIWGMWGAKGTNEIAKFAPAYTWALWWLEANRNKITKAIHRAAVNMPQPTTSKSYICDNVLILCEIGVAQKNSKQAKILEAIEANFEVFLAPTAGNLAIVSSIRLKVLDYLAEQIDESFVENFASIIDAVIEQLQREDIISNFRADVTDFLKKIYEKVDDDAKKIIGQKISSLSPEIRIAVLPDEALLPVYPDNAELLENEKTGAEYVGRLFGVLQEEVTSHQSPVTSYKEELLQLKGVVVDNVSPVNIAREITRRLEELKAETIDEIEKALKDKPSKKTGDPSTSLGTGGRREMGDVESLTKAKEKIQKTDFIQPLRAFKEGKRKFFRYSAEMDINRILSKGRREGFGMFILPIPLSLLDAETFQELGNRIKGFLSGAKERVVRLFRREREDVSREKIKLNQARLAGFGEEGKERAVIIHHELFRDNPIMGRIIMSIVKQLREAGVDNLKVVLALDDPRRAEDFYKRIKKAGKGIDLRGQFDFVVSAQEPAENVIREIKTKYSGIERIDVLGIPAWAEKYEKLPELKDNIMVICELGDENSIAEGGLGAWQVFNEFLNDEDREKLFGRGAMTTGFFKYKSKRVDKKFQRYLKSYRKFAESN